MIFFYVFIFGVVLLIPAICTLVVSLIRNKVKKNDVVHQVMDLTESQVIPLSNTMPEQATGVIQLPIKAFEQLINGTDLHKLITVILDMIKCKHEINIDDIVVMVNDYKSKTTVSINIGTKVLWEHTLY